MTDDQDHDDAPAEKRPHSDAMRRLKKKGGDFARCLSVELERALRYDRPLSLLIVRAERATRAHAALWDTQRRILFIELQERALHILRTPEFFAQVSERDFAVCLPETGAAGAAAVADKFQADERIQALSRRIGQGVAALHWRQFERTPLDRQGDAFLDSVLRDFDLDSSPHAVDRSAAAS